MPLPCKLTLDAGYLCANFSLPRSLCSQLRPDVRDRQTDRHQTSDAHHRLMLPPNWGGAIASCAVRRHMKVVTCTPSRSEYMADFRSRLYKRPGDLDLGPFDLQTGAECRMRHRRPSCQFWCFCDFSLSSYRQTCMKLTT